MHIATLRVASLTSAIRVFDLIFPFSLACIARPLFALLFHVRVLRALLNEPVWSTVTPRAWGWESQHTLVARVVACPLDIDACG